MQDRVAKILIRLPDIMRRKLKVAAAISNISLNQLIISYLENGLLKTEKKFLSCPKKMMFVEDME